MACTPPFHPLAPSAPPPSNLKSELFNRTQNRPTPTTLRQRAPNPGHELVSAPRAPILKYAHRLRSPSLRPSVPSSLDPLLPSAKILISAPHEHEILEILGFPGRARCWPEPDWFAGCWRLGRGREDAALAGVQRPVRSPATTFPTVARCEAARPYGRRAVEAVRQFGRR